MNRYPFRLLTIGYGLAALGAVALWLGGAGALAAGLTLWLGGAAAVLAIAAMLARGHAAAAAPGDHVVRDEKLRLWEQDRRLDAATTPESAVSAARRVD